MNESTIKKAFYIFPGQQDCCPCRQRQVNRKSDSMIAAHPCVPTFKPPVLLVAVYLSRVYKPTHQTRALYPTLCGLKSIIIPPPAPPPPPPPANLRGVQRHTLCTKHGQSKVTVSVLSLRMPTITSVLLYVTRLVSIVCYKNHNPFFPQEFEIEHWKEMKAKLLLSITL